MEFCSEIMRLLPGYKPKLAWKFSDGRGSKEWITLYDEDSYRRMMKAAAKRIRDRAKKESNLKDADLSAGWRIDLKVLNKVERIVEKEGEEDTRYPVFREETKEKKRKKKKKGAKEKVPKKRKRGGKKKAFPLPIPLPIPPATNTLADSPVTEEEGQALNTELQGWNIKRVRDRHRGVRF